jgi:hypothetical protein
VIYVICVCLHTVLSNTYYVVVLFCLSSINENTEGAIKNGQSRETGNIGYTRHKVKTNKTKPQHNMCWTPPYVNKHKIICQVYHCDNKLHLDDVHFALDQYA